MLRPIHDKYITKLCLIVVSSAKTEVHPPFFNGKTLFKNVILKILNFILHK